MNPMSNPQYCNGISSAPTTAATSTATPANNGAQNYVYVQSFSNPMNNPSNPLTQAYWQAYPHAANNSIPTLTNATASLNMPRHPYQQQLALQQQMAFAAQQNIASKQHQTYINNNLSNYSNITQQYAQLVKHPNFSQGRSPFFQVEKRVCVMPVFDKKRIQFRISLQENDVKKIRESIMPINAQNLEPNGNNKEDNRNNSNVNNGVVSNTTTSNNPTNPNGTTTTNDDDSANNDKTSIQKALHLRLFGVTQQHQDWNTSFCDVTINNRKINIDKRNTKSGIKEKGYHIVKPLDITKEVNTTMDFEISSNQSFSGVAVIEIVRVFEIEEIAKRVIARCQSIDTKDKQCAVCKKKQNLLRCSRCKCIWYCGTKHQAKDWPFHQTICTPTENKPKLMQVSWANNNNNNTNGNILNNNDNGTDVNKKVVEEEVICGEVRVSLRDPLSIIRIEIPVRGSKCSHPQCVDLNTFLAFCHQTGNWQCPVCIQPLRYEELVVDDVIMKILKNTTEDIDQIRLFPDGSYKEITLQELQEEDRRLSHVKKKRKYTDDNNNGNEKRLPPNLRAASSASINSPNCSSPSNATTVVSTTNNVNGNNNTTNDNASKEVDVHNRNGNDINKTNNGNVSHTNNVNNSNTNNVNNPNINETNNLNVNNNESPNNNNDVNINDNNNNNNNNNNNSKPVSTGHSLFDPILLDDE